MELDYAMTPVGPGFRRYNQNGNIVISAEKMPGGLRNNFESNSDEKYRPSDIITKEVITSQTCCYPGCSGTCRQGPKGDIGPKGNPGPKGIQGVTGPQGEKGHPGPRGEAGIRGPRGYQGLEGQPGIEGIQGPKGDPGERGPEGPPGSQGPEGKQGCVGPQGERGPIGPEGIQGLKGDRGEQGPCGPQGPIGRDGPPGIKGDKGDRGPQGERGPVGPPCECSRDPVHTLKAKLARMIRKGGEYYMNIEEEIVLIRSLDPVIIYVPLLQNDHQKNDDIAYSVQIIVRAFPGSSKHKLLSQQGNKINDAGTIYEFTAGSTLELYSFGNTWYVCNK